MKTLEKEDLILIEHRLKNIKTTSGPDEFYGLAEPLPIEDRCTSEELIEKKNEFIRSIILSK